MLPLTSRHAAIGTAVTSDSCNEWLQIAAQSRAIVAQEQMHASEIAKLRAQLMHDSAAAGIQSFSPLDFDDGDKDE